MTIETLKKHLLNKKLILEEQIKLLKEKQNSLPKSYNDINLAEYGSIANLRKLYSQTQSKNLLKKFLGPTTTDLKKNIYRDLHSCIKEELSKAESTLQEIINSLNSISNNKFIQPIYPNSQIIKEILYLIENKTYTPEEGVNTLIELFRISKNQSETVENKIASNLLEFYDYNNHLKKESKLDTILLLYEKLFFVILTKEEQQELHITITAVLNQIKLEYEKLNETEPLNKEELLNQQKALEKLSDYIEGEHVAKPSDNIQEFREIASASGLEAPVIKRLETEMEIVIAQNNQIEESKKIDELLHYALGETELKYLEQTLTILKETPISELTILLSRIYQDIISICKYIIMSEGTNEYETSLDLLTQKMRTLKVLLIKYQKPDQQIIPNTTYYATDKNYVPFILRSIESLDVTLHDEARLLLESIINNSKNKAYHFRIDKIDFCLSSRENISVLYARKKREIVIVDLLRTYEAKNVATRITKEMIESINSVFITKKTEEYLSLHQTFENIIAQSLSLNECSDNLTLHKRKKD